jgi:hypothetical protein
MSGDDCSSPPEFFCPSPELMYKQYREERRKNKEFLIGQLRFKQRTLVTLVTLALGSYLVSLPNLFKNLLQSGSAAIVVVVSMALLLLSLAFGIYNGWALEWQLTAELKWIDDRYRLIPIRWERKFDNDKYKAITKKFERKIYWSERIAWGTFFLAIMAIPVLFYIGWSHQVDQEKAKGILIVIKRVSHAVI